MADGTTGQRFQVNGHGWVDLPQPTGTPEVPQRFYRMLHGNNAVPVPLAHLQHGVNTVQFAAGPQLRGNWGFFWINDFTVRVFNDPARPHPTGEIVSPKCSTSFADSLTLEARASSPNGAISRVEFIGEYDDFDWDGDGVWREWQFTTHHGVLQHHPGTATSNGTEQTAAVVFDIDGDKIADIVESRWVFGSVRVIRGPSWLGAIRGCAATFPKRSLGKRPLYYS